MRKNIGKLGAIIAGLSALYSCTATNPRGNSPPEIRVDGTRADKIPVLVIPEVDLPEVHQIDIIDKDGNKIDSEYTTGEDSNLNLHKFDEETFPGSNGSAVSYKLEVSIKDSNREVPQGIEVIITASDYTNRGKKKGDSRATIVYGTVEDGIKDNDNLENNLNDNDIGNGNYSNGTTNDNDTYGNDNFIDNDGNINDNYSNGDGNVNENTGNYNSNGNNNVNDNHGDNTNQNHNVNDNTSGNGNGNMNQNENDNAGGNQNENDNVNQNNNANENDNTPGFCDLNNINRTDLNRKEITMYGDCGVTELYCLGDPNFCDINLIGSDVGTPVDVYVSADLFCGNVAFSAFLSERDGYQSNTAQSLVELLEFDDGRAHFRFTPMNVGHDIFQIRTSGNLTYDEFLEVYGE